MIRCSACKQDKPEDSFALSRNTKTGRQNQCRMCHNALQRRRRVERRAGEPGYAEAEAARWKARHDTNMARSNEMKLARGCERCGARPGDPSELHWDHIDPSTKWSAIGSYSKKTTFGAFVRGWSWERIEKELEKCRVLCQPCHMRRTWDQRKGTDPFPLGVGA